MQIVVIDRDHELLDASSLILEAKGYEVSASSDPVEGYQLIKDRHPLLVILDSLLDAPSESFKLAEKIRQSHPHISIIMLKQPNMEPGTDDLWKVDDFIDKPFSPSDLIAKADRYLQLSENYLG